jgi:hypothetical protein
MIFVFTRKAILAMAFAAQICSPAGAAVRRFDHTLDEERFEHTHGEERKLGAAVTQDLKRCPHPFPTAQMRNTGNRDLRIEYVKMFRRKQMLYERSLAPGTFVEDPEMFTTIPEGNFVFWGGAERGVLEMTAFNEDTFVEGETRNGGKGISWRFVPPKDCDLDSIKQNQVFEGDHVAFIANKFEVFAHFFLDYLGYIAYLREVMPSTTRFILADVRGGTRSRLEMLDPEFCKRVDWIDCQSTTACNAMVQVRNGSLTVMQPVSNTRHMDLLFKARQWILEANPPKEQSLQERTVVYYTRNAPNAGHGRAMDRYEERAMLDIIQHAMDRNGRQESLVIFDGTQSFEEQIDLFQSANVVIGAHGGGLANLLFLLPSQTCDERPKVLEFLTNPLTPGVQRGTLGKTYYHLYSTCVWAEYHHVFYVEPSSEEVTYVDLGEFEDAVNLIFSDSTDPVRGAPKPKEISPPQNAPVAVLPE